MTKSAAAAATGTAGPLCSYNPLVTLGSFHYWFSISVRYGMADFKNLLVLACAGLNGSLTLLVFLVVVFSLNQDLCIGCLAACFANVSDSFFLLLCSVSIDNLAHAS